MSTARKPITKAQAIEAVRDIIREKPDAVNPAAAEGGCVYHRGRGRNIKRCLIGELGFRLGLPTPTATAGAVGNLADDLWDSRFTYAAVQFLQRAQAVADGGPYPWEPVTDRQVRKAAAGVGYSEPVPWGSIKVSRLV